jgi:methylmalonyl-CoA carboxyltransferase large subunit
MVETIPYEVASAIDDIREQLALLSERLARLETPTAAPPAPLPVAAPAPTAASPKPEPEPGITEEELLAISGALAAYLGVRVHIRQIRLISSPAWAQEGRVSLQASHRLHS